MSSVPPVVAELADLFAAHRILPFLGAGCSVAHVHLDWDAVRDEMSAMLKIDSADHAAVASAFVGAYGRVGLAAFLRERLEVERFDPSRGNAFMTILGTRVGVIYTTNQDNLVELCFAAYGRPLSVVVGIDDIAQLRPGSPVLYKFHGGLEKPESIVFTAEDYARRGPATDHPLDIRLRSDALAKSLLFVGYSFRDPNVRALLQHLRGLFGGRLPPSYLVQFRPDASFADSLREEFGIEAIDPTALYPGADSVTAFDRFLVDLTNATVAAKTAGGLADALEPKVPTGRHVVAAIEIDAVDAALSSGEPPDALVRAFRATYDYALIHQDFDERVATQFVEICRRVDAAALVGDVRGALFNLHVTDLRAAMLASAAAHATVNVMPKPSGLQRILFHTPAMKEDARIVAVAFAIRLLRSWGRDLTPTFYDHVAFWDVRGWPTRQELRATVGDVLAREIEAEFDFAYARGKTTYEHPLDRAERLQTTPFGRSGLRGPGFDDILRSMLSSMPKKFPVPWEG